MDDPVKNIVRAGMVVGEIIGKGKSVYAERAFRVGDIVLEDRPVVCTVKRAYVRRCCEFCFETQVANYKVCTKCRGVYYCGRDCQKKHWKLFHRYECDLIAGIAPNNPTESILLTERLFQKEELISLMEYFVDNKQYFSHKEHQDLLQMSLLIKDFDKRLSDVNMNHIIEILCKLKCNVFNIHDQEMNDVGVGLFPSACLFNHNCNPNVVPSYNGNKVTIRAIKNISPGDEICVSYVELGDTTEERRRELFQNFYFHCECDLCSDVHRDDELQIFLCECGTEIPEYHCSHCGIDFDTESLSMKKDDILKRLKEYKANPVSNDTKEKYIDILHEGEKLFSSANIYLFKIYDEYSDFLIKNQNWSEAKDYLSKAVDLGTNIYPDNWPPLGLLILKLGKLESFLEQDQNSIQHLKQAITILRISMGNNSPVKIAEELLHQLQMDIQYHSTNLKKLTKDNYTYSI